MEELKKAQAKKEVSDWKRVEKEAGVSSKVPADIKEHEVIMNYLLKKGQITKRQAEGLREWQQVDNHVCARRRKFLEPYTLEGSLNEKIQKVKYFLNRLGSTRIEARTLAREKHNEGVRERNAKRRERISHKQFKEEQKKEMEIKKALTQLPERERKLVEDPHHYHPHKIKKRKAEEETQFNPDTFARDVRRSKREKKKVKVLVEEIAKRTDLPENKIQAVIAKVHKANKLALAVAKDGVNLPPEEPTRQSERLKEHTPVHSEKKQRVKRKDTYFKTHKLTKEERKAKRDRRRKAFKQIDLNAGFAKGHLTKDVAEKMGVDDLFKGGAVKKNVTKEESFR